MLRDILKVQKDSLKIFLLSFTYFYVAPTELNQIIF